VYLGESWMSFEDSAETKDHIVDNKLGNAHSSVV